MKIWDRIHCRWIRWHGARTAWLKLPHAVIVASCTVSLGALAVYHLRVEPTLPSVPIKPEVTYAAPLGYLNPYDGFRVVPYNILVGDGPAPLACDTHYDHDKDDCKQPKRTVPEPSSFWLMLGGVLLTVAA